MNLALLILAGAFLIWCGMGVASALRDLRASKSRASRILHAVSCFTSVGAGTVVLVNWTWLGLALGVALAFGAFLLEAIAGRVWAARLLTRDPAASDVFLRDP